MSGSIIINQIKDKMSTLNIDDKTIVVLKGIPVSAVDPEVDKIVLSDVVSDKMGYFMSIYGKRKFLSYEEFLLISDFVIAQYKEVIVLKNNLYMDLYPVENCFTNDVKNNLLAHFEESKVDEDDETYIGDIDEYIAIFDGIKEYNGYLLGAYNEPSSLKSNKVVHKNVFDQKKFDITSAPDNASLEMDLIEESDYIDLVKRVFSEPDELYIRISNYTGNMNRLKDHIALLAYYWKDYTPKLQYQIGQ